MTDPVVNNVADAAAVAASVAVKLPEFWKNDPVMWFAQAEAQFALANVVKDETKFYHIVAKIDQTVICHVTDLVTQPPAVDKYNAVKTRLISRFQVSAEGRLERLLSSCDLGDMRPTHLLAKMLELAAGLNVTDDLMKMLFLQRMPPNVKAILTISDGTLGKLAEMADKMLECSSHVTTASVSVESPSETREMEELRCQIASLTTEIKRIKTNRSSRSRSSSRSRQLPADDEICWFHRKFGSRALNCREPCKFYNRKN